MKQVKSQEPVPVSLLRPEVFEHRQVQALGPLLTAFPLSYEWIGWMITFSLAMLLLWSGLVTFQEKTIVSGYLDLKPSLVNVFPLVRGIVIQTLVREGQVVKKGDILFKIKTSFNDLHQKRFIALGKQRMQVMEEIKKEQAQLLRYHHLVEQHFISKSEYNGHVKNIDSLLQNASQLYLNMLQAKFAQTVVVTAPLNGRVSRVETHSGQLVTETQSLLTIRPALARWVAYLWVPMQGVRFIHATKTITLHYDAYPSNQFGSIHGKVSVQAPVLSQDVNTSQEQPVYQVEVSLPQPYLHWHGKQLPLLHGMRIQAILPGRKQRLWAWLRTIL